MGPFTYYVWQGGWGLFLEYDVTFLHISIFSAIGLKMASLALFFSKFCTMSKSDLGILF